MKTRGSARNLSLICLRVSGLALIGARTAKSYMPDISLIRHWDELYYHKHPMQPFPRVVSFEDGRKRLTYVATKHKKWQASQRLIQETIQSVNPDVILIEGLRKEWGLSPHYWDDKIHQNLHAEGYEAYYAYKIAQLKHTPYVGSELPGKMSAHSSYERDVATVNRIAELLNVHHNVLVVYGAGHYVQQEAALIGLVGRPLIQ
jgi:hypothetical protein